MLIQTGTVLEREGVVQAFCDISAPEMKPVRYHLQNAGAGLAKGEYGNAVDEAASALEACFKVLTNRPDEQFGDCLKVYEKAHPLQVNLKNSILQIWGYANAIPGGRHSEKEDSKHPRATAWDAQYCYIQACGAISYVINRSQNQRSQDSS